MGRTIHPALADGAQPVSASPTAAPGFVRTPTGMQTYVRARALRVDEIQRIVEDYRSAARNAWSAGFDGVQINAANGYLIDQFLRDGVNFRNDRYGGAIENRIRLLKEVTEAVMDVVKADRIGVRLSPNGCDQGVWDSHPEPVFVQAAKMLSSLGVAYLELREPPLNGTLGSAEGPALAPVIRKSFSGVTVLNSDYTFARAECSVAKYEADAISFGRPFIANPDLPERLALSFPLATDVRESWFSQGSAGYTDYETFCSSAVAPKRPPPKKTVRNH